MQTPVDDCDDVFVKTQRRTRLPVLWGFLMVVFCLAGGLLGGFAAGFNLGWSEGHDNKADSPFLIVDR